MQINETLISVSRKKGGKGQKPVRLKIWNPVDGLRRILKEQEKREKGRGSCGFGGESRVVEDYKIQSRSSREAVERQS